jgi:hypothetical protein
MITTHPMITPTTRAELALMVPHNGLAIELGVAAGEFAEALMRANPRMRYCGIDRWSDHHDEREMRIAAARLEPWPSATLHRATFREALTAVLAWSADLADLIYIDGYAHTGQEGGETLRDWWPMLKPGGIFAGHDYDPTHYPQTVEAVDEFARQHRLELFIIEEPPHPSWWLRKP